MLTNQNITAFAATTNPERAKQFYQDVLGLTMKSSDQYAIAFNANGIELRVAIVSDLKPQPFTILGWHVDNIAEEVTTLSSRGVTFERYSFMEQDELGIWRAPEGARVAWFKDPDGNLLSVAQY